MTKLINELNIGDKVFVIYTNNPDLIFDIGEVTEDLSSLIRIQLYFGTTNPFYIWKYNASIHYTNWCIVFTDETEALFKFQEILKHNGRNR